MTTYLNEAVVTFRQSFSFYVGPAVPRIEACLQKAGAVTIRGRTGPRTVIGMREAGLIDGEVMFDREGWKKPTLINASAWVAEQRAAGAHLVLTPGRLVPWDACDPASALRVVRNELELARRLEASPLLAIDSRWLSREPLRLVAALREKGPVAVVLVDGGDPLARSGAGIGLRHMALNMPDLILVRCDHACLGALAFGALHGSIGLIPGHRHGTTPDHRGFARRGDFSPRVFDYTFLDWFTANNIAGWSLVDPTWARCYFACCDGQELARFHDEDNYALVDGHNMTVLAAIADDILGSPDDDRRMRFHSLCKLASEKYGQSGERGPVEPKAQLTSWLLLS